MSSGRRVCAIVKLLDAALFEKRNAFGDSLGGRALMRGKVWVEKEGIKKEE